MTYSVIQFLLASLEPWGEKGIVKQFNKNIQKYIHELNYFT